MKEKINYLIILNRQFYYLKKIIIKIKKMFKSERIEKISNLHKRCKMKSFKSLELENEYRTDKHNIYEEFYEKCLGISVSYDRAVGYFTSGSLKLISKGLEKLIENNGKIRIVTSPNLTKEDLNAIKTGEEFKKIEKKLLSEWSNFAKEIEKNTLKVFSWLVAKGKLEIKIAYQDDFLGLYHEKFGVFKDEEGNRISFSGSVNETIGGMKNNFESIDVYSSLEGSGMDKRIKQKESNFENLWCNNTNKINVITLPEAIKQEIIKFSPDDYELKNIIEAIKEKKKKALEINSYSDEGFKLPSWLNVRPYQKNALNSWFDKDKKGILEMATGTGKTITALNIMYEVNKQSKKKNLNTCFIILCPLTYLTRQWEEECDNFNLSNVICNSTNNKWQSQANLKINKFNYSNSNNSFALIVTNDTFKGNKNSQKFKHMLKKIKKNQEIMIIIDECHNVGTKSFEECFEEKVFKNIKLRLGLSATPERQNDDVGNKIIKNYLDKTVYYYSLKEAIENNFLTKYYYYPHYVSLTENENEAFYQITQKAKRLEVFKKKSESLKRQLKFLYIERSRIINLAEEKTNLLINLLDKNSYNNLIYVGASKREEQENKNIIEIKEKLEYFEIKFGKFTAEENNIERLEVISKFINKEINGIVAIKCLDEGINIPSIHRAYVLASTTNYREYVQRRGRILRKSDGKKYAEIHDFILIPNEYQNSNFTLNKDDISTGRLLLKRELKRVEEYNSLAENRYQNEEKMFDYKKIYDLLEG